MQPIELRDVINVHVNTCPSTLNNKKSVCEEYACTHLNLPYEPEGYYAAPRDCNHNLVLLTN